MSKSIFVISLARPGFEALWRDLFEADTPSKEARKAEQEGAFNQDAIDANSRDEAIRKARQAHPEWVVMDAGTGRLG